MRPATSTTGASSKCFEKRAVSIAIADFPPNSDSSRSPHTHSGYEYGFVLEGKITVEVSGTSYDLSKGDLISYSSRTPHRIWNRSKRSARTERTTDEEGEGGKGRFQQPLRGLVRP